MGQIEDFLIDELKVKIIKTLGLMDVTQKTLKLTPNWEETRIDSLMC